MRVEHVPYDEAWPARFEEIARRLRAALGEAALAIHHIGSTAIQGLAAKDVIDVQVTVGDLSVVDEFAEALEEQRFVLRTDRWSDHPTASEPNPDRWIKRFVREARGDRRTHVHVRELGRPNQRYAVLFRDYLRSNREAAARYEAEKRRLAIVHNFDSVPYADAKDVICDELITEAEEWADRIGWTIPPSDA